MLKGLHHNAYRCRDSEETRRFYEDFLGLPLAETLEIKETKSGRKTQTLHDLPVDRLIRIVEGTEGFTEVPQQRTVLGGK